MVQYVFHMQGLNKQYPGGRHVLKDIHLNFLPGVKIAVIGVNGSGKSTLMRIMSGIDKDFTGEAWAAEGIRTGYLSQEPYLDPEKDVLGNVRDGVAAQQAILDRYNEILADYSDEVADEMARLQDEIDANNLWELDNQVDIAMDALRCPAGDADVTTLSGGERRRVALCRLLLEKPDLLMLDEPTNHLDAESVAWLERFLQEYKGTVVLVTHDRYFLDNVVGWVLELDRGHGIPFEGNYSQWLEAKQKRLAQEERKEEAKEKALARELEWIRSSPKARQSKSKARIRAYDEMLQEQQEKLSGTAQIKMQPPGRLGGKVIEFEGVSKAFGDRLLYENLTFSLPPGGIVGVIGPNGAGKTTLFKLITGEETPDAGSITIGETVKLGYVDQSRDALDDNKTVWEEVSGGDDVFYFGKTEIATRSYVGAFNFKGSDQQKKVGLLSGGERNRVHLAKMLRKGGNVLLLDEPTNDLDVETLRALEEALENFAGCAVVISHDRFFLDRLATHILAFEGDSHVEWFEGNFQAYEADRKRRLGDDANTPHRLKFKKFNRS
ncbi:energy-dependent translational throttle protein EttA [Iodidimonas gelatinilytica]|uniref:Energy-dependent translational throttle protein EttA n=1 Tax=Iodidimonas gelatinilytica TaxID=1236966 RepID=A0A5A7MUE5_9PROT|nr:energy-dependent translational throttle protein EttA [Iodidimonas gelatinilytica]GEQ98668.1 energy-dependent translational throttle protein EttA [Iodidimonas gelatinilytica]